MHDEEHIDLSVVVPTYRGRDSLPLLVRGLGEALRSRGLRYEVILVNDHSPDDTWAVISQLAQEDPCVVGIDLLHNHGQAMATMCGLSHACGELVATMDDDLEQPPDQLLVLVDALEADPDLDGVVGNWPRDHDQLARRFGSWVHARADRIAHGTPPDWRHTTFRLMRRPLIDGIIEHETRQPVLGPLVRSTGGRLAQVEVRHDQRAFGSTGFSFGRGIMTVMTNVIHGSTFPLRVMSTVGFTTAFLSLIGMAVFIGRWLSGADTPPGWLSATFATLFLGGTILLSLGILGQYVHVIIREVRHDPRWSVRRRT